MAQNPRDALQLSRNAILAPLLSPRDLLISMSVMLGVLAWVVLLTPVGLDSCRVHCAELSKWVSLASRIPFVEGKGAIAAFPVPAILGYTAALFLGVLAGLMAAFTRLRNLNLEYSRGQLRVTIAKLFVYLLWSAQFFVHPSGGGDGIFTLFERLQDIRAFLLLFVVIVFTATAGIWACLAADIRNLYNRVWPGYRR